MRIFLIILLFFCCSVPSNAYTKDNRAVYSLKKEIKKIDYDINQNYCKIRRISKYGSMNPNLKALKIKRLQNEISRLEKEKQQIKLKCKRIISKI